MKKLTLTVMAASCVSATAFADNQIFDVRTAYMGGAGIAGQRATAGVQLNPANLALPTDKDTWGLTLPVVSAGLSDPNNLRDTIDTVQNTNIQQIDNDIQTIQNTGSSNPAALTVPGNAPVNQAMTDLGKTASNLESVLASSDKDQLFANATAGAGLAIPGKKLGFGIDVTSSVQAVGQNNVSQSDLDRLQAISNVFTKGYVTAADQALYPTLFQSGGASPVPNDYTSSSSAHIVGLGIGEVGFSFAHQFALGDMPLAVGIKPKLLTLRTYDYSQLYAANGFKVSDFRQDETSTNMVNADAGTTLEVTPGFRLAATVTNAIRKSLQTTTGQPVTLEPKVTVGAAYDSRFFNWALDVETNRQTSLGFNTNSQIASTGVEFNAWNAFRFGVGYRHNLISNSIVKDVATAGFSTSLLGLNLGLAAYGRPNQVGGAFQISLEY